MMNCTRPAAKSASIELGKESVCSGTMRRSLDRLRLPGKMTEVSCRHASHRHGPVLVLEGPSRGLVAQELIDEIDGISGHLQVMLRADRIAARNLPLGFLEEMIHAGFSFQHVRAQPQALARHLDLD